MTAFMKQYLPLFALLVSLIYTGVHWTGKVLPQSAGIKHAGQAGAFLDFDCYWEASQHLSRGQSVYTPTVVTGDCSSDYVPEYIYLPTLALMLTVLDSVGHCQAEWVWFGFNVLVCLALIPLLIKVLNLAWTPGILAVTIFLVMNPMATLEDITLGQVNLQILALLLIVAWLLGRKKAALAGFVLGLAFAIKLIPALFGIIFLRGRRTVLWPVFMGASFVLVVFLLASHDSPGTFMAAINTKTTENLGSLNNSSLVAWLVRSYQLGPEGTRVLVTANTLIVIATAFFACFWSRSKMDSPWLVTVLLALVVSLTPLYEVHHQVMLYPGLLLLVADAFATKTRPGKWWKLIGITFLGILTNSRGLVPINAADNLLSHLFVKPAGLALVLLVIWLLWNIKRVNSRVSSNDRKPA